MRTEEQIVYEILNTVHGGQVSGDDTISERLVRSFLRKHRASKLAAHYAAGMNLDDFIFQSLGALEFQKIKDLDYRVQLPAIINFPNNYGIRLSKNGYYIPVVDRHAFELSKKNIVNKSSPKATMDGHFLTLYVGYTDLCNFFADSEKELAVAQLKTELEEIDDVAKVTTDVSAVLYDPGEGLSYDWTRDPYPCPSEIIDKVTTSTLARDLDLMIRTQSDTVSNIKSDNVNFDDTHGVKV